MTVTISGTSGIVNDATDLNYTGTLTGGTGVVNLGSGQVYKDASGNVGIGTSSPSQFFQARKDQAAYTWGRFDNQSSSASAYAGVQFGASGNTWGIAIGSSAANSNALTFVLDAGGSNSEKMRLDISGNLLVGTTSASNTKLRVVTPSSTDGCVVELAGNGGTNLGANRTGASGSQFVLYNIYNGSYVGGISMTSTGTSFNTSSDYRLKDTIAPMVGALSTVAALKPCTYKWKRDGSDGQGFIAHELAEVVPDCVTGEKDAVDADGNPQYQGIDTSFLVATLAAAIQEQQTLITALTARITALETAA